ncbi:MAG: hypothetical protein SynsKO_12920 [Synoicihabitans sp.]
MLTAADISPARRSWDLLRGLLGVYFWLLFLEGALRKWFLIGFTDIIYILRDPLVIWIYVIALKRGVFPHRPATVVLAVLAGLSLLFSLSTENPVIVTLFGLRTNYLHPPLLFVMGAVLDRNDVIRYCRWILYLSVPILILMIQQFQGGSGSTLNAGVGGSLDSQLTGGGGKVRPSGPFSFTTGPVFYFGLVTAIICHGWYRPKTYPNWLLVVSTVAVVVAVPVSISRGLLLSVLIAIAFAAATYLNPRNWGKVVIVSIPLVLIGIALYWLRDSEFTAAFNARWVDALNFRGGGFKTNIVMRVLDDYLAPFRLSLDTPWLGHGIGRGTMAGARLTSGQQQFLLAEGELARIIQELGPFLGFAFISWRAWLGVSLLQNGWATVREESEILPWVLAGTVFLNVLSAQWGQATMLGFTVFTCGLSAAALNAPAEARSDHPDR